MKAILIDSANREVRELEVDGKLEGLQKLVGGYIELVRLSAEEDLYVNEEGLLHGEQNFFQLNGYAQPLAGNGVVVGNDGDGGQVSTRFTVEYVSGRVRFMDVSEAARAAQEV